MQFSCHLSKFQSQDIGGIHAEQLREYKNENNYKNYVDPSRTSQNLYMELTEDGRDWNEHVRQAKADTEKTTDRKTRKDAVVICSVVETVPVSWPPEVCKKYFTEKAEWYRQFLHEKAGIDNDKLLSMCVHLDEASPHATYVFIPEKAGRLQANNIVTKVFLKQLQSESQRFCFNWIDNYNREHENKLEKLEPYTEGSTRKHLQEQEYKLKVKTEQLADMNVQQQQLERKMSDTKAKISGIEDREALVTEKEKQIVEITRAPSLSSYSEVKNENQNLKQQLSIKDRIITQLKEENQKMKDTLTTWMSRISKLGMKVASVLGFSKQELDADNTHLSEFPNKDVKEAYEEVMGKVKQIDPQKLRVIPDKQNPNQFVLASKSKNGYSVQESGFSSREKADSRRRDLINAKISLDEDYEKNVKNKQQLTI